MTQDGSKRKLAAILSADVKGYSLLLADDETFTIRTLKEYRGIMPKCIEQHNGRVVDSPGDNLLAEFSSVVDTVQCAVEIQKQLKKENERLTENKQKCAKSFCFFDISVYSWTNSYSDTQCASELVYPSRNK